MAFVAKAVKKVVKGVTNLITGVVDVVVDAVEWVVDEIIEPVVKGVGDVIEYALDDPIKTIATIAAIATGNTWAIPLIDGASVLAKGGNLGDAVKAAAISYAGAKLGSVTGQYASKAVANAGGSALMANVIGAGTKSAATALVYGQDPLKAFATGGLQAGLAAGMGKISETMKEQYGSKFEDLQGGVKDTIFAGLAAELEGGNLSETQLGSIINKYSGVGDAMNNFLKENAGFSDAQAAILTNATAAAVSKALAGNPDGAGEAFFGSISAAGADALKTIIDKPVNKAIDKVSGAYNTAEAKAKALNDTVNAAKDAADKYNALQSGLAGKIQTQEGLKAAYDRANAAYIAKPSEATAKAANTAADKYNDYASALEVDYNKNYKNQLASAEATFTKNNGKIEALQKDYDDSMGWVVSKTEDLDAVLKPKLSAADKAVALTLRPNFDEDAYRNANGLSADADVYGHFLQQGQAQPTDKDGTNAVLNRAQDTLGQQIAAAAGFDIRTMSGDQITALYDVVNKNVTSVSSIAGLDFDALVGTAKGAITEATPFGDVLPTAYDKADNVTLNDIVTGSAQLTKVGNTLEWQKPDTYTNTVKSGGGNSVALDKVLADASTSSISSSSYADNPNVLQITVYTSGATLPDMINDAQASPTGTISNATLAQIAGLGKEAGRLLDTYVTAPIYEAAKDVYNYVNEGTDGGLGNAGSIVIGSGGEILQAIAGLSVLAGANPNNAVGRLAKDMIALSGDMKSDEWKAAAADMQANTANYDEKWRKDNPGKEPSTAQKAYLKTAAIFGNIYDHPLQWVSENVVNELLQEIPILLVSGGTGNVAKRLLLESGEAYAKKVAGRVAIGTGVTLDAAEAFGGTAAGAFDEAYGTALKSGMDEQQATDYAMDVAQKAGSIAVLTLAATAGIGGQALSKSLFGDKGSEFFVESYEAIKKQVKDGAKVTIKEGITESIEEALPQLYVGTSLAQIDPSYDIAGSVFEAAIMGSLAGAGTAGGIYTGDAVASAIMRVNPAVKEALTGAGSATDAAKALKDMGISDNEVLNNLLNTTYDAQYVTTTEAGGMFAKANPGFTPTESEIAKFAGTRDEAKLAADVAAYVDPRFLDADEVKAAALAEGITLTDEQAEAYVGRKNEASAVNNIKKEYDPKATSYAEAEKFFSDLGFTPTKAQIDQFVGAKPESTQKTAINKYVDPRQVTEAEARKFYEDLGYTPTKQELAQFVGQGGNNFESAAPKRVETYVDPRMVDAEEVTSAYELLGLARPTEADIESLIGQYMETDLAGRAEENLPAARYNSIMNILDNFTGEVGVSDEMKEALEIVKGDMIDALGDLGLEVAEIDRAVTEVKDAVAALPVGATPEEVSAAINSAISGLENLSAEDVNTAITTALEGMNNLSTDDVQGIVDAATGTLEGTISGVKADLTKLIEDNAGDVDAALTDLATSLGITEAALLAELNTTKETLTEQFTEGLSELETDIGEVATGVDDLTALVEEYETAGVDRDTAISLALEQLSTELGQTETDILAELGLTEAELGKQITDVETGLGKQITDVETGLGEQITDVETGLGEQITDVETSLGADIQTVADLIGKPAREVTQTDVDFVIDLIAQENVAAETIQQYDVTGDGVLDINDQNMLEGALQGDQDITFADTSMFDPATGLYLQQEQDTQATMDAIIDMNTQLNTQINTNRDILSKEQNVNAMMQQITSAGDAAGQQVTVTTPDPMNIDYLYDIGGESIFATPSQAQLFGSPYGGTRAERPRQQIANTSSAPSLLPRRASGFAKGGQVEDETDMLLRILGDM